MQHGAIIVQLFSQKYSQKTPHSSLVRAMYEVCFVDLAPDWYSASVSVIINVLSYHIEPLCIGTQLYSYKFWLKSLYRKYCLGIWFFPKICYVMQLHIFEWNIIYNQ